MYRGVALTCPACRGTLEYTKASLPVHGCAACGGLWLGPDAAIHVLQGRGGALESEVVDADRRGSLTPTSEPILPDAVVRRCPSCDLEMAPLTVGAIRVDSCPAHGTWFDRLEVTRVTNELLAITRRAKRPETGIPSFDDVVDGTASLARELVTFPFQLVQFLVDWLDKSPHGPSCTCRSCKPQQF